MNSRVQTAVDLREKHGYNCAQAILCAYADIFGLDEAAAYRIAEGFGTGMGGMGETCGALMGAFMLLGLKNGSPVGDKAARAALYKEIRDLSAAFQAEAGTTLCRELKGQTGLPVYPCAKCIETAAKLIEERINAQSK